FVAGKPVGYRRCPATVRGDERDHPCHWGHWATAYRRMPAIGAWEGGHASTIPEPGHLRRAERRERPSEGEGGELSTRTGVAARLPREDESRALQGRRDTGTFGTRARWTAALGLSLGCHALLLAMLPMLGTLTFL